MERALVKGFGVIIILLCIFLNGCYSTDNSEAIGSIKIQENKETSTYLIFGFGLVRVTRSTDANIEIIKNTHLGFGTVNNSKTGSSYLLGLINDKATIMKPDSNTIHEIKENMFSDEIKIEKVQDNNNNLKGKEK
jgi:hypothetical protein